MKKCLFCGRKIKKGDYGRKCGQKARILLQKNLFYEDTSEKFINKKARRIAIDFLYNYFPHKEFEKFKYKYPFKEISAIENQLSEIFNLIHLRKI